MKTDMTCEIEKSALELRLAEQELFRTAFHNHKVRHTKTFVRTIFFIALGTFLVTRSTS
jgi:hypothetical protein